MTFTTALVIIAASALGVSFALSVLMTVTLRQALQDLVRMFDRESTRRDAQMSALLDRFQAIRWEDLIAVRAYEGTDQGGFLSPEDQQAEIQAQSVTVDEQVKWGPLSRFQRQKDLSDAEQALLAEDFPDDYPATTEVREAVKNEGG